MRVYLSGGMRSDWQDKVIAGAPQHEYIDPRQKNSDMPNEYTFLDLVHIGQADLILAYLGVDNPSGYGLSLEIGYAIGLGKPVIFVTDGRKYVQIVEETATLTGHSLAWAIEMLNKLQL